MAKVIKTTLDKALKFNTLADGTFLNVTFNDNCDFSARNITREQLNTYIGDVDVANAMLNEVPYFTWYDDGGYGGGCDCCFLTRKYNNYVQYNIYELFDDYVVSIDTNDNGTYNISIAKYPKQKQLISGTNIKTINGTSLLGSGNISSVGSISQDINDGHKLIVTSNGNPSTIIIPDNDTHYTTKLVVTNSTGTANASTTNGNTKLRLFDNSTARNTIGITGTGGTTVSSDGSGNITINSTGGSTVTIDTVNVDNLSFLRFNIN